MEFTKNPQRDTILSICNGTIDALKYKYEYIKAESLLEKSEEGRDQALTVIDQFIQLLEFVQGFQQGMEFFVGSISNLVHVTAFYPDEAVEICNQIARLIRDRLNEVNQGDVKRTIH